MRYYKLNKALQTIFNLNSKYKFKGYAISYPA
jgi:hypothetical protein